MRIAIVSGSHREKGESLRVSRYIEKTFAGEFKDVQTDLISLSNSPFPLWEEEIWDKSPKWQKLWQPTAAILKNASALVVVSPEWSGMVPAGLKNFFLLCSAAEIGHKPGLIVTVSSGMGGAYPVTELRTSSYKNTRLCYIPEHMIIRHVTEMLHGDNPATKIDGEIRNRLLYCLQLLHTYAQAFEGIRSSGVINHKDFPNGL